MSRTYAHTCKVCGAPRYDPCPYALCERHYLAYNRRHSLKGYYQARRHQGFTVHPRGSYRHALDDE